MTSETRTPEEIEREIEMQRSALSSNLDNLQDKFSIDGLVRQIGEQFREHGGDMSRSIAHQVKANPIPLALTGIGLAWMMFANDKQPARPVGYGHIEDDYRRSRLDEGRPYTAPTARVDAYDPGPSWARDHDHDSSAGYGTAIKDGASKSADAVRSGLSSAATSAGDAARSAKSSLSDATDAAKARAAAARDRIAEGTEQLTEEGRRRVIAARQKALEVKRSTMRNVSHGTDAAADFYDRQPLVVGALALAVGAALGGALPRTRTEDEMMGAQSDELFATAERIYEEEKAKVANVAQSVTEEVKDIASETKADLDSGAPGDKTAAEALGDKAKAAARRVEETARTSAQAENLGKPKTG